MIFVIVLDSAFNVASSLYISVVRSTPEIAILKALGLSRGRIATIFSAQGFLLGAVGAFLGFLLGLLFCWGFMFLQNEFGIIQASVYKIDHIDVQVRWADLLVIFVATLLICTLATWAPARRAANLSAVEGLRQE